MKKYCSLLLLTLLIACKEPSLKSDINKSAIDTSKNVASKLSDIQFQFDDDATVNGCANVLLQKFSKDLQNELFIELKFDSIPKFQEIDIRKYSKFIHIYFNKYSNDNKYIDPVCNDARQFPKGWKKPVQYAASAGYLTVTYWSGKTSVVSAITKNLVLEDSSKNKVNIPLEAFEKLHVGWVGG